MELTLFLFRRVVHREIEVVAASRPSAANQQVQLSAEMDQGVSKQLIKESVALPMHLVNHLNSLFIYRVIVIPLRQVEYQLGA